MMDEDRKMDSDQSSSDDDSETDDVLERQVQELNNMIQENPFQYNAYIELIKVLRNAGELVKVRDARERMNIIFPLSPKLWLEWIEDEMKFSSDDRTFITELFDRAVKDYVSVDVWLEYVQYAIGGMAEPDGLKNIRQVFERAITAVGLHVSQGSMIWDAYREFENAILMGLQPSPGAVTTPQQQEQIQAQTNRVSALFRRQLSVPLMDMESTFDEYKEWSEETVDSNIEQVFKKTKDKLLTLLPFEDALLQSEVPHLDEYLQYIKHELAEDEPSRIQCVYERSLEHNCLVPKLWIDYGKYVDTKLRAGGQAVSLYERSVRNCPWSVELWIAYARSLERNSQEHEKITGVYEQALSAGMSQGVEFLLLWTAYCDYLRRRISWANEHTLQLEELRVLFRRAITQLSEIFPQDGDPNCTLLQYWARLEAKYCKNMEQARELWNEILHHGFGNQAVSWIEYLNMERAYGDHIHCRKILQRAVNSVSDYPETIFEAYINFEREEGTLEQYDQAITKCEAQLARVEERRAKAAEKEQNIVEQKKKQRNDKKSTKKSEQRQKKKSQIIAKSYTDGESLEALERLAEGPVMQSSGLKRKHEDDSCVRTDNDGFKVPHPPGFKPKVQRLDTQNTTSTSSNTRHTADGKKRQGPVAPPPGFKPKSSDKPTSEHESESMDVSSASDKSCTVFVSNLAFDVGEVELKNAFSSIGNVKVQIVKNFNGQSKGFAYVEFNDEFSVAKALTMDRTPIGKRPMFISPYVEKGSKQSVKKFRYDAGLEKSKIFIKGLPFTMDQDAVETMFKQFGSLKSVRLVTYRNGHSKGLAYVEYENASDAGQAVLRTDQSQVGENVITVAISNPPPRKQPMSEPSTSNFTPTLGSGKRETSERGKARTQVSLVPRSLQHKPDALKPQTKISESTNGRGDTEETTAKEAKMSNDDFRNMLLGKK